MLQSEKARDETMAGGKSEDTHKHKRKRSSPDREGSVTSDSSSSDSEQDRRKEKKHKKKHKKEKKNKQHVSKEEKALLKQAKKLLKAQLKQGTAGEAVPLAPGVTPLTADDYFQKNAEFTAWLLESRNSYFNELKSDESRKYFDEFITVWNSGRLAPKYYQGLVAAPIKRTTHAWNFKGGLDGSTKSTVGMSAFVDDEQERRDGQRLSEREALKGERSAWNKDQRLALDELLPKATGRDAMVEKRMARREDAKAREGSPDLVRLPGGGDVMGGEDSFAAAKARQAKQQQWVDRKVMVRQEEVASKLAVAQAAEDAKMAQFKALAASGRITIAKRQP